MQDGEGTITGREAGPGAASATGTVDHVTAPVAATSITRARTILSAKLILRLLLSVAAAALLVSPRFPYWNMKLAAPQYPRGLYLAIYPDRVTGDVDEIDALNHYIGMRKIGTAAVNERRLGIPAIWVVAACLVIAALLPSRWAVLLVIPAILFPPLFLGDLYWWLRDSGLGLDPKAPLSSSIKPFVPQFLGAGKIGQFRTEASLGVGCYLSLFALAISVLFATMSLRPRRERQRSARAQDTGRNRLASAAVIACLFWVAPLWADTVVVQPTGSPRALADALDRASSGDTIVVQGGVHAGPLVVRKAVRLTGEGWPVLDGQGHGTVVRLEAPASELRGFVIRGSGDVLAREDAGVLAAAPDLRIEGNSFEDVLFGVYLRQAPRSLMRHNTLHGKDLPVARRGDLIRLWYSNDVTIDDNTTEGGRDVVLWYSNHLNIRGNRVRGGRYGLHFMYCHDATVVGNRLCENSVGAFLMYSRRLQLRGNWIADNRGPSGYGIGLKDMDDGHVLGNVLGGNKVGLFLEHANAAFENNLLADNDKGIVIFPSARGNRFEANTFVENGEQVAMEGYADTMTTNVWRGNFWSDYRGYDAGGDGTGDITYRPARLFERLSDRNPALRLFAESPSAQAIDFAARAFPIFAPKPKFTDDSPRMRPLPPPVVLASKSGAWQWPLVTSLLLFWPIALVVARSAPAGGLAARSRAPQQPDDTATATATGAPPSTMDIAPVPAISVRGLTKRFAKVTAVDDLSFEVRQGETVALWGRNGAGKTTVLRCVLGLFPFRGTAHVLGWPCGPRGRASRQRLGYVPQEVRLHADQTVRETVLFYARLRRVPPGRIDRLIREWGLDDVERRPVSHLSGGMKQKLALVVALLADPPVLLLDEPTSNLDAHTRGEFSELLGRLKAEGKTLLFCTHRPSEVWKLADRVVVLERGCKVAEGPPETVRAHLVQPAHLGLMIAAGQSTFAAARLRDSGFLVETSGSRIWVDAPAGRKLEAIELLNQAGVRILDFDLESERDGTSSPRVE
jgi:nitrous oxidase accessory protein